MPVASQSIARIFEERKADKIAHANLLLSLSIMESIKLRGMICSRALHVQCARASIVGDCARRMRLTA